MKLDEVLGRSAAVPELSDDRFEAIRTEVRNSTRNEVRRVARLVRRRRRRLALGALTAAAVAAVASVMASSPHPLPPTGPTVTKPPVVHTDYKTVADVIDAATTAPSLGDPATAPYWKVVRSSPCPPTTLHPIPKQTACTSTIWWGNGRPTVIEDNGYTSTVPGTNYAIFGRQMDWQQLNAGTWTDAQIASLVSKGRPPTEPASWFDFQVATGFLADAPASDTIRKQLWRYLATIPGIRFDGKTHDSLGRAGWRVSLPEGDGATQSVVIDPSAGRVLEETGNLYSPDSTDTITFAGPATTAPQG